MGRNLGYEPEDDAQIPTSEIESDSLPSGTVPLK